MATSKTPSTSAYIYPRTTVVSIHGSAAFAQTDTPVYVERQPGYGRVRLYPLDFKPPIQPLIFPPPPPPAEKGTVLFVLPSPPSGSLLTFLDADYKVSWMKVTEIDVYLGQQLVYQVKPGDKNPLDGPIHLPIPRPEIDAYYIDKAIQVVFHVQQVVLPSTLPGTTIPQGPGPVVNRYIDFYSVGVVAEEFYKGQQ